MKKIMILAILGMTTTACGNYGVTSPSPEAQGKCIAKKQNGILGRKSDKVGGVLPVPKAANGAIYYLTSYVHGSLYYPQIRAKEIPIHAIYPTTEVAIDVPEGDHFQIDLACVSGPEVLFEFFYTDDVFIDSYSE